MVVEITELQSGQVDICQLHQQWGEWPVQKIIFVLNNLVFSVMYSL